MSVMKARRFTALPPVLSIERNSTEGAAALRDFDPVYVADGSFTSEGCAAGLRDMSAMPPIAPELIPPGELTLCARTGREQMQQQRCMPLLDRLAGSHPSWLSTVNILKGKKLLAPGLLG
jgi:hypothetical protein